MAREVLQPPDQEQTYGAVTDIVLRSRITGDTSDRFVLRADGQISVASGSVAATDYGAPSELLAAGQAVPQRVGTSAGTTVTLVSGTMLFSYFKCRRSATITTGLYVTGTTVVATPTRIRYGLYSVSPADGALTLVAATADGTTGLTAANTRYPIDYAAPVALVAGATYASGILVVAGTMPSLVWMAVAGASASSASISSVSPRVCGSLAGQTDLPASVAGGSVNATSSFAYCEIY